MYYWTRRKHNAAFIQLIEEENGRYHKKHTFYTKLDFFITNIKNRKINYHKRRRRSRMKFMRIIFWDGMIIWR